SCRSASTPGAVASAPPGANRATGRSPAAHLVVEGCHPPRQASRWTRTPDPGYAPRMIFLHETHDVAAGKREEFWEAVRTEWRPLVEEDGAARLLWAFELTHGTGVSYQAITITA